jgi:UDP-N-acetylglucosamine 1-carboxyvinyltransferase
MNYYRVTGGTPLRGEVAISGAKNSALKLIAASLLVRGKTVLQNVPRIRDVLTMIEVLKHLGVEVLFERDVLTLDASGELRTEAPYALVRRMRASINVLGPLLAREGHARVALPGGCNIGSRPIDIHERGLERLGAKFVFNHGYLEGNAPRLSGGTVVLDFPSTGATENILTAAVLADGETVIENAAREPQISTLVDFLAQVGAHIEGAGTSTLTVHGVRELKPTSYRVPSDPIEAGSFALAVLASRGNAEIKGARPAELEMLLSKITETGATWTPTADGIRVSLDHRPTAVDFVTLPYPGFPTDLQAPMVAYLAAADGVSIVTENVFESRFMHVAELVRMGADIRTEGHHAVVRGVPQLQGAPVRATDLRSGAALVVAALSAQGESEIHDIHHIERGHEDLVGRLKGLGASIDFESQDLEKLAYL